MPTAWRIGMYEDGGRCPVEEFILDQTDRNVQAKIIRKAYMVVAAGPECKNHLIFDTYEGPIKYYPAGRQPRIYFSWEEKERLLLLLAAEMKKNGKLTMGGEAVRNHARWVKTRASRPLTELAEKLEVGV